MNQDSDSQMDTSVGTALQQRTTYINNSISPDFSENRKYATYKCTVDTGRHADGIFIRRIVSKQYSIVANT